MMLKQVFCAEVLGGTGAADEAVTVFTAQVDLDLETEAAARRELARLLTGSGRIVVDVSEVFVAVVGLRLLLNCVGELRRGGRRVELVVNPHLHRVARVLGEPFDVLQVTLRDALIRVRSPIPDDAAIPVGEGGSSTSTAEPKARSG